ncbi:hypothetical protein [uncultured Gammaproteobacteria bacterium]|nr:hypothetical protein [uncultured Gammaproteobacteria bacterium]CAC9620227.1 hypothetical protein [uncultured Gammaproteobacteria bacterium]CAC9963110.1 hypothetical protein [uncultured Gammaproteobacteria bacterium]
MTKNKLGLTKTGLVLAKIIWVSKHGINNISHINYCAFF